MGGVSGEEEGEERLLSAVLCILAQFRSKPFEFYMIHHLKEKEQGKKRRKNQKKKEGKGNMWISYKLN